MKTIFKQMIIVSLCIIFISSVVGCAKVVNPAGGFNEFFYGYVKSEGNPVSGIKVSSNYGYTFTDENGYYEILSYYLVDDSSATTLAESKKKATHKIVFTDVDGEENGKYMEQTKIIKAETGGSINVELVKEL